MEYKKVEVPNKLFPEMGIEVSRTSYGEFDFYNFKLNKDHFVITYFKELDAWTVSTGSRLFTSFFDGAVLSEDRKLIRFYIFKNSKKVFTSTLFLRNES